MSWVGEWCPHKTKGDSESPRYEHSACFHDNRLYIFGGRTTATGKTLAKNVAVSVTNRIQVGRNDYLLQSEEIGGPLLIGHACVSVGNKIYLIGGKVQQASGEGELDWSTAVRTLIPAESKWDVEGDRLPAKLFRPAVEAANGKIFVFGGSTPEEASNHLLCYTPHTGAWDRIRCTGIPPSPRVGHTMTHVPGKAGGFLVIFGGHNPGLPSELDKLCKADVHFFSLENNDWGEAEVDGQFPPPLYGHTACFSGSSLYVLGGTSGDWAISDQLYELRPREDGIWEWFLASTKGEDKPEPRCWHTTTTAQLGNSQGVSLFLFGGQDQSSMALAALYQLTLKSTDNVPTNFAMKKKVRAITRLCNGQPACATSMDGCTVM